MIPRVAANASAISSSVKTRRARLVHALHVGPQREDEHHVGQVDCLTPRTRAHLCEGRVDEEKSLLAHQKVGRLDVAVGETGVPELTDDQQSLVDDGVIDFCLTDFVRTVEELRHEQVLALRRDLYDPVGLRYGKVTRS